MSDTGFIRKSLFMLGGLLIWAAHFTFVYGFHTLACTRQLSTLGAFGIGTVPFVVAVATAAALAGALGILLLGWWRRGPAQTAREEMPVDTFMRYTAITTAGLSIVAIVWTGVPAFIVPPCG